MTETADILIAGGGVMGSAIAHFLLADPTFDGTVVVVEPDPSYGACSTTRSWGGVRQQFSTAENVEMSLFGASFVKRAAETLEVDGEKPELGFKERGYLMLADTEGLAKLRANCQLQCRLGARTALLEPAEIARRFPWLNTEGLAGAGLGLENEGWIDPAALLHAFKRKAISGGARYVTERVAEIELDGGGVSGARLERGGRIACESFVNAAGPRAGYLAASAGVELPVRPRKRSTFVFDCRTAIPDMPLTIGPTGVVCRPEGAHYITIVSPPDGYPDPDSDDLEPDYSHFEEIIWPTLAARIPAFEAIKLTGAWGGHYDYNTFDQNAILGPHPEIRNLYFCNGFSGHGLQQAPAAGRALAEVIIHGRYVTLDLTAFGYERILHGHPLKEKNVI